MSVYGTIGPLVYLLINCGNSERSCHMQDGAFLCSLTRHVWPSGYRSDFFTGRDFN